MSEISIGTYVRHRSSGWAGNVTEIDGDLVTVRPTHPRPKEVLGAQGFVPTPDDWSGWAPLTVRVDEVEPT